MIDYRFDNKNFANDLSKRFDHITIIEKKIENNRQILTRLRQSLRTNSNEFQICVSEIRATLLELNENEKNNFANDFFEECEKNNSTNDFSNVLDEKSNVIIDE